MVLGRLIITLPTPHINEGSETVYIVLFRCLQLFIGRLSSQRSSEKPAIKASSSTPAP